MNNTRFKYIIYIPEKEDNYKHEESNFPVLFETFKEAEIVNNSKFNSSGIIKPIKYISC